MLAFDIVPAPIAAVICAALMLITRVLTLPQFYAPASSRGHIRDPRSFCLHTAQFAFTRAPKEFGSAYGHFFKEHAQLSSTALGAL
jgi:hypothetical protein